MYYQWLYYITVGVSHQNHGILLTNMVIWFSPKGVADMKCETPTPGTLFGTMGNGLWCTGTAVNCKLEPEIANLPSNCWLAKWMFPKIGGFYPQIIHFNRVFHYKPSILGYPYFWKHPNQLNQFFFHSSRLENCRKSTLFPLSATLSFLTKSSNFVLCNPRGVFWPQYQNLKTSFMYVVVVTLKVERHIILSFWSIISESKLISVLLLLLDFFFKQKRIP